MVRMMRARGARCLSVLVVTMLLIGCEGEGVTDPFELAPSIDRFLSISAGSGLTCGVGVDHYAYCWGANNLDQVGSSTFGNCLDSGLERSPCAKWPQRVSLDARVTMVSAGHGHACALSEAGEIFCWGYNGSGQAGVDGPASIRIPARVASSVTFTMVQVAAEHTCAIDVTGVVWCWGVNDYGQLGRGTNDMLPHPSPAPLQTDLRFVKIGPGFSQTTCALTTTAAVYCWGANDAAVVPGTEILGDTARDVCTSNPFRRFGDQCNMTPRRALPNLEFDDVVVGQLHACGRSGGSWICWGNGGGGNLGIGTPQSCADTVGSTVHHAQCNRDRVPVTGSEAFPMLGAGGVWSCALDAQGFGWCWGYNSWGGIGTGEAEPWYEAPVRIDSNLAFASLSMGGANACALTAEGVAWCWGYSRTGSIGNGEFGDRIALSPRQVVARP